MRMKNATIRSSRQIKTVESSLSQEPEECVNKLQILVQKK